MTDKIEIELVEVKFEDKAILRQLLELYLYDFSEFDGEDVNEHGRYGYLYFDHYWTEENRHPFFIKVDGRYAGFVLINDYCHAIVKVEGTRSIAEFFVMRKYRKMRVGKTIAHQIFDRFPSLWEVAQHGANEPSKRFWEKTIAEYTGGDYRIEPAKIDDWPSQAIIVDNTAKGKK